MKGKKLYLIILVLVLIIGGTYLVKRGNFLAPTKEEVDIEEYFEFKDFNPDITKEQKDESYNYFLAVVGALREDPDKFNSWLDLASVKKYHRDYEGAEQIWLMLNSMKPENSSSFSSLGDLYTNFLPNYEMAELNYKRAIINSKGEQMNRQHVARLYGLYYDHMNDKGKAIAVLEQGIVDNPGVISLRTLAGDHYYKEGDIQRAIEYYEAALELEPSNQIIENEIKRFKTKL